MLRIPATVASDAMRMSGPVLMSVVNVTVIPGVAGTIASEELVGKISGAGRFAMKMGCVAHWDWSGVYGKY
ncbi:putative aminopeptidase [Desulfovibrio ferrophilus]|uniref:Putative aminopeptidase n=1 Tax=Desulfovibrio ferrophilus TaxID=241368 RepID=A0A2Z6AU89_9BACT|nr:putative aminopeptidase [Desulfovibrio ferrophilus]